MTTKPCLHIVYDMRKKTTDKQAVTLLMNFDTQHRLKMESFDLSRKAGRHISMSEIVETSLNLYFEAKEVTSKQPNPKPKFESLPRVIDKPKATTSKPKKGGKLSKGYLLFEAIYDGKGKDDKSNPVVLFKSIQSSEPGLEFETSSKHKVTGKAIKEFLATNPAPGCRIRFEAFIENGKIAQPREIEAL